MSLSVVINVPMLFGQEIEKWMNDRPRKCLKFKTSGEVFKKACCT